MLPEVICDQYLMRGSGGSPTLGPNAVPAAKTLAAHLLYWIYDNRLAVCLNWWLPCEHTVPTRHENPPVLNHPFHSPSSPAKFFNDQASGNSVATPILRHPVRSIQPEKNRCRCEVDYGQPAADPYNFK